MGDAAEVLTALYEKLAGVAAQAGQPSMLDDNFGLHVKVRNVFTVPVFDHQQVICLQSCHADDVTSLLHNLCTIYLLGCTGAVSCNSNNFVNQV